MEAEGLLDIGSDIHMYALRYVFQPRINAHLKEFAQGWNNHPLSTERNMSPAQLWLWGLQRVPYGDEFLTNVRISSTHFMYM